MTQHRKRHISQRVMTATALALVTGLAMSGCSAGGAASGEGEADGGTIVLQSRFSDGPKEEGMVAVVEAFNALGEGTVEINTVPTETFRTQLPTYLTSQNPPDVYTWFAGESARAFASQGLLLDITDVWEESVTNYPEGLRELSQDAEGTAVFLPTEYYWWGVYYRKSEFERLGVQPAATWDEFLQLSEDIQGQGGIPIGIGLSDSPWFASAWFDSLNNRINGADFHLDLLAGEESFDSPEVRDVMSAWNEVLPYFDPGALGLSYSQAFTDFGAGKTTMILAGSSASTTVPEEVRGDLGFFQFPIVDPSVPIAEEAPTDGFFASAATDNPELVKRFLAFLATAEAQEIMLSAANNTLAANPDAVQELDELAIQGKEQLESADQLTQFFNRDGGDFLQPTADAALGKFFADPSEVDEILSSWQSAAEDARANQ